MGLAEILPILIGFWLILWSKKIQIKENIKYYLLYPDPDPEQQSLKVDWKIRMEESGMDKNKIKAILDKWNDYINDFDKETFPYKCTFKTFVNWTEITVDLINSLGFFNEIAED